MKQLFWQLRFGDDEVLPEIDVRATYVGPEVTIDAAAVEGFCGIVGNQGEHFKSVRIMRCRLPWTSRS